MEMLRFLQITDIASDGAWAPWTARLPLTRNSELRAYSLGSLRRAVDLARREAVDVVLCAGGLWDDATITPDAARDTYDTLGSLAPTPVIITPGTTDPLHPYSFHAPDYFHRKTGRTHPANVTIRHPGTKQTGAPEMFVLSEEKRFLIDYLPTGKVAVSSQSAMAARLEGVIAQITREGIAPESMQYFPLDSRRLVQLSVTIDTTVAGAEALWSRISEASREAGVNRDDLLVVDLNGTVSTDLLAEIPDFSLLSRDGEWFHALINTERLSIGASSASGQGKDDDPFTRLEAQFMARLSSRDRNTRLPSAVEVASVGLRALRSVASEMGHVD